MAVNFVAISDCLPVQPLQAFWSDQDPRAYGRHPKMVWSPVPNNSSSGPYVVFVILSIR